MSNEDLKKQVDKKIETVSPNVNKERLCDSIKKKQEQVKNNKPIQK